MNALEIINQAKEELKKGDFFNVIRAKNILLNHGFINIYNEQIKTAFFELFPPSKELQYEMVHSLKQLFDNDLVIRRKASSYLERKPRKSINGILELWLKDPRTIDILCKALSDEDVKVQDNIIMCLGNIADRYHYNDTEIYNKIVSKFEGASNKMKVTIAQSICSFPPDEKWDIVNQSFDIEPTHSTRAILGRCIFAYGYSMPVETRKNFFPILFDALNKEKSLDTKYSLLRALEVIGNEEVIKVLNIIKHDQNNVPLIDDFNNVIQEIQNRIINNGK